MVVSKAVHLLTIGCVLGFLVPTTGNRGIPGPRGDPEALRNSLIVTIQQYRDLMPLLGSDVAAGLTGQLDYALEKAWALAPDDLAQFRFLENHPEWWTAPRRLLALLQQRLPEHPPHGAASRGCASSEPTCTSCPSQNPPSRIAVQIAKGVHTTLDHADNLVPEVAVYLKIVTSTLAHLAEVVVDAMETAIDENGDCEDDYHLATVNALLPDVQTKVVDIQTKVTDIQEKVDRLQDLALRVPIEVDLRRTGEDRVGLFQLPQGYGGQLEMVREIVVETINMHWAAGQSVHDSLARRSLADGDVFALRREFKRAYDNYRLAYQLAVKP